MKKSASWSDTSEDDVKAIVRDRYDHGVVDFVLRQAQNGHPVDIGWGWLRYQPPAVQPKKR